MELLEFEEWKKKLVSQRKEHYKKLFEKEGLETAAADSLKDDAYLFLIGGFEGRAKELMLENVELPTALWMAQRLLLSSDEDLFNH